MQTPLGLTTVGLLVIFVTVGILIRGRVNPIMSHDIGACSWCPSMWIWSRRNI